MVALRAEREFDADDLGRLLDIIADHLAEQDDPIGSALALIKVLGIDPASRNEADAEITSEALISNDRATEMAEEEDFSATDLDFLRSLRMVQGDEE